MNNKVIDIEKDVSLKDPKYLKKWQIPKIVKNIRENGKNKALIFPKSSNDYLNYFWVIISFIIISLFNKALQSFF